MREERKKNTTKKKCKNRIRLETTKKQEREQDAVK